MMKSEFIIPHSRPFVSRKDLEFVSEPLLNGEWTTGKYIQEFQKEICRYIGSKFSIFVNSGTSALHLAIQSLITKKKNKVIIPSYCCAAVLEAVRLASGIPIIIDIDSDSYNLSFKETEWILLKEKEQVACIILPHMFGLPAPVNKFVNLGIPIIEDLSHAIGTNYNDESGRTGSKSVISICSMGATKMLSSGIGGMLFTSSTRIYKQIISNLQISCPNQLNEVYPYNISDIHAALGISQLQNLDMYIKRRRQIANVYSKSLNSKSVILPQLHRQHAYYRYIIKVPSYTLENLIYRLHKKNIYAQKPVYYPLHRYQLNHQLLNTDKAFETALSIPIYPSLNDEEVNYIIEIVYNLLSKEGL
ncbi:hypothetical protein COJ27_29895 [Bacillus cereus]|uniref:DegT/DnrJ/EryC1/StrS family aminotransferase n=1 Tax=Bacillus cereus TaxID=1396 RepID=UPI000BF990DC|nr:DegT/DnrJ/EryC1/StrS family aminotransferase [Bacillus cereus]PFL57216.1 hypothetical protein COJ27_29895 [Bacillus cereus]